MRKNREGSWRALAYTEDYLGGGVGGPNRPGRTTGLADLGVAATVIAGGMRAGFGIHCVHAGMFGLGLGLGASICGTGGLGGRLFGAFSRRVGLCTTRHAGRVCIGCPSSTGGGVAVGAAGGGKGGSWTCGFQSGEYCPPAPCFDLTAMSSAISNCSCLRSSLNFPTSARRILTSLASALLKSFKYFGGAP